MKWKNYKESNIFKITMDFLELVKKRRSVRRYKDKEVDENLLFRVLEAGRLAPSACNYQPWLFIVIKERELKLRLSTVYNREWFFNAPIILAVCCDHKQSWHRKDGKDFGDIDIAIAMDHMTLAAEEIGLGTCWIGNFIENDARKILQLPDHISPVVFSPLGFPAEENNIMKIRKSIQDITYYDYYGKKLT